MITSQTQQRLGPVVVVTVVSDLTPPPVYFHWYVHGAWIGPTTTGRRSFAPAPGEKLIVEVNDTLDPDYDAIANAPAGYPARRTLWWNRSIATDVSHYLAEENKASAGYVELASIPHDDNVWDYRQLTDPLDDLTSYEWRIRPVDLAGNIGTAVSLAAENVVRFPDAPDFTASFDGTDMTFAAA